MSKKRPTITSALSEQLDAFWVENCLNHLNDSILITEAEPTVGSGPKILWANDVFYELTGFEPAEVIGKTPRILQGPLTDMSVYEPLRKALDNWEVCRVEVLNYKKDGSTFWNEFEVTPVANENGWFTHWISVQRDVTDRKQAEEKLERIALYDLLTGLPNRALLADRLSKAMYQCKRRNRSLGVAFMDLDGFKAVNDAYGHTVGDKLLVALSNNMGLCLREGDTLARIGGDEFIVLMEDLENIEDSEPVLNRLLKAASSPVTIGGVVMEVSVSIGLTLHPEDSADADQLMRHADQAMYLAKQSGKNRYHVFDVAHDNAVYNKRAIINDIRTALDRQQFVLYYQPQVNMRTGEVIGSEALIRWQHPTKGLVPPLDFLPFIENNDLTIGVGEWVLEAALRQIFQWNSLGINLPVSVNIDALQLTQENFPDRLASLLKLYPDVNPKLLGLEILETSTMNDISQVSNIMVACRSLGIRFSLDDFGTGYSSLTYLRRLPAEVIKIDQTFVRDMLDDPEDLAIIQGIIGLAGLFQRKVVAEGVETIAHGKELIQLGCEVGQGYGIARPMPANDIPGWIEKWNKHNSLSE